MSYAARRSKRASSLSGTAPTGGGPCRSLSVPVTEIQIGDRTFDPDGAYQVSAVVRTLRLRDSILIVTELTEFLRPVAARLAIWRPVTRE